MTELELRKKVVSTFLTYEGCKKGSTLHHNLIDTFNSIKPTPAYKMTYNDAWCAATVSAIGWKCGLSDYILPHYSCGSMINLYKAKGLWKETDSYKPQIGDLIMYDWNDTGSGDCTGAPEHVGMVISVSGSTFVVLEGNKGAASVCGRRTMSVNGRYIRGFCLPDYAAAAKKLTANSAVETATTTTTTTTAKTTTKTTDCIVKLPILSEGSTGSAVETLQILLDEFGYKPNGIDGSFGPGCKKALIAFQKKTGLAQDGTCGPATWTELLRGDE